ncbi:hypothetical protein M0804_000418 [Polistes exclamans]|nr:hypothetical protein M0804_000418 [Polistes exclamans]
MTASVIAEKDMGGVLFRSADVCKVRTKSDLIYEDNIRDYEKQSFLKRCEVSMVLDLWSCHKECNARTSLARTVVVWYCRLKSPGDH